MGRKALTTEEYKKWLYFNMPHLECVGEYKGTNKRILHRCKIHGYEWEANPNILKSGSHDCLLCNLNRKKTEYIKLISETHPNLECLGEYKGVDTKILHRCKIHDYEWSTRPSSIKQGKNCPICSRYVKPHEKYVEELAVSHSHLECLEKYKGVDTKILHRCKIHGYEWKVRPTVLKSGTNCPVCSGWVLTHEMYEERLFKIKPHLEVKGEYTSSKKKVLHRCKIHDYEWEVTPTSLLRISDCPICSGSKKTHKVYAEELSKKKPHIEVVGDYIGSDKKILHRCKIHDYEWDGVPSKVLNEWEHCPYCRKEKRDKIIILG